MNEEQRYGWGGARPGAGRPKGRIDSRPREIREAMLEGAMNSEYGKDPKHPDEPGDLARFFTNMANKNIDLFCAMLTKLIPRQINTQVESTIGVDVVYRSVEEVKNAMQDAGMSHKEIAAIEAMLPVPIINDDAVRDDVGDRS
jgi:hypothetical protein